MLELILKHYPGNHVHVFATGTHGCDRPEEMHHQCGGPDSA